ncbi:Hypothetical_protein [Hexamita inflata]|uniref:Hypothetical_protein n=1 Tax=Hexamita inflata TaxID=28002 RepID=A0AA86V262_9EUKA|nr:Hypothetical protein HINF_LOCUS60872 [Hexamita inflata]
MLEKQHIVGITYVIQLIAALVVLLINRYDVFYPINGFSRIVSMITLLLIIGFRIMEKRDSITQKIIIQTIITVISGLIFIVSKQFQVKCVFMIFTQYILSKIVGKYGELM